MSKARAVFLDRDGVINKAFIRKGKSYPPSSMDELEILPGVLDALNALKAADFLTIVVTNQPDVANGITSKETVMNIHQFLMRQLPIDEVYTCFHNDHDRCACRKPLPGLLFEAARNYHIDLHNSYMIGDRWRDIEAGQLAQCRTFFINYGYLEKQPTSFDYQVRSLNEAAQIILGEFDGKKN